jgi:adenylosuccinate synthase
MCCTPSPAGCSVTGTVNLVGNGVVIDPVIFLKEVNALKAIGVDVRDLLDRVART